VVFTPLLLLLLRRRIVFQAAMKFSLVLALCVAAFAGPWLIRNHAHFGQWNLASRGGEALYTRAMMNDMSRREYAVALMLYSHYPLNGIFRRALGLSRDDVQNDIAVQRVSDGMNPLVEPNDLQAEMAGRPEDTITFYRRGRAEHVKLAYQMGAAGVAHPEYASDSVLIKRGLAMIAENPLNHLAYTLLWLWGDVFFTFPPLMCALALALWRRDAELLIYVLPSFGLVMFYALVSFYVPRYGLPAYPPAVAAGAILACAWLLSRANRSCAG
ncbi:MAG: hypothetical protein ABIT36_09275, partial [Steroidobacteraceae bacterium]